MKEGKKWCSRALRTKKKKGKLQGREQQASGLRAKGRGSEDHKKRRVGIENRRGAERGGELSESTKKVSSRG